VNIDQYIATVTSWLADPLLLAMLTICVVLGALVIACYGIFALWMVTLTLTDWIRDRRRRKALAAEWVASYKRDPHGVVLPPLDVPEPWIGGIPVIVSAIVPDGTIITDRSDSQDPRLVMSETMLDRISTAVRAAKAPTGPAHELGLAGYDPEMIAANLRAIEDEVRRPMFTTSLEDRIAAQTRAAQRAGRGRPAYDPTAPAVSPAEPDDTSIL
jgi:hypothetical protein